MTTSSEEQSFALKVFSAMHPRAYYGQYSGLVPGLREFVWLGLTFVYPVWLVALLLALVLRYVLYYVLVAVLWVLFIPVRLFVRVTHRGDFARTTP
jgi:hypothetical protein